MKDKPVYKSKTILAGVAIAIIGLLKWQGVELPYEAVYSILAAFGLYGVRDAIANNK